MAEDNQTLFRKKAMARISSPEDLTGYLRVTSPGMWIILAAVIVLLAGLFAWSAVGTLETTVDATAIVQDHTAQIVASGQGADELEADAVGLIAAYGRFDPETEKLFLGIRDGRYVGGRLGNYTDTPESLTEAVCDALERVRATIDNQTETEPFQLIPALMQAAEIGETKTQTRRNTP